METRIVDDPQGLFVIMCEPDFYRHVHCTQYVKLTSFILNMYLIGPICTKSWFVFVPWIQVVFDLQGWNLNDTIVF